MRMGFKRHQEDLKDFKYFTRTLRNLPKKAVGAGRGVGALVLLCEIGDPDGRGPPENMDDTHPVKWPHAGFGPNTFNAVSPENWPPG